MPNTKSAIRRVRRVKKQTQINRIRKSKYKNAIKQMELLLKNKEKGAVSSVIANCLCNEAKVSLGSINLYGKLANLMNKTLETGRLKLKVIDFVNVFLKFVDQVIPSISAQIRKILEMVINASEEIHYNINNTSNAIWIIFS